MSFLALPGHLGHHQAFAERGAVPCWPLSGSLLHPSPLASPQIYADPSKRLELYFRPKDPYCHPVCANRFSTSSLLLRIRRKTKRQKGALGPEARPEVALDIEILGIVSTIYKFQGNCQVHSYSAGLLQGLCPGCLQKPGGACAQ